jgi:hypothetical protein
MISSWNKMELHPIIIFIRGRTDDIRIFVT